MARKSVTVAVNRFPSEIQAAETAIREEEVKIGRPKSPNMDGQDNISPLNEEPYLQTELHWRVWGHKDIWPYH